MDHSGLFSVYFRSFHMTNKAQIDYNDKSVDGVLETQTQGWQYGRRRRIH